MYPLAGDTDEDSTVVLHKSIESSEDDDLNALPELDAQKTLVEREGRTVQPAGPAETLSQLGSPAVMEKSDPTTGVSDAGVAVASRILSSLVAADSSVIKHNWVEDNTSREMEICSKSDWNNDRLKLLTPAELCDRLKILKTQHGNEVGLFDHAKVRALCEQLPTPSLECIAQIVQNFPGASSGLHPSCPLKTTLRTTRKEHTKASLRKPDRYLSIPSYKHHSKPTSLYARRIHPGLRLSGPHQLLKHTPHVPEPSHPTQTTPTVNPRPHTPPSSPTHATPDAADTTAKPSSPEPNSTANDTSPATPSIPSTSIPNPEPIPEPTLKPTDTAPEPPTVADPHLVCR